MWTKDNAEKLDKCLTYKEQILNIPEKWDEQKYVKRSSRKNQASPLPTELKYFVANGTQKTGMKHSGEIYVKGWLTKNRHKQREKHCKEYY